MKNRLEELRKQKGIKQEELANAWKYQADDRFFGKWAL